MLLDENKRPASPNKTRVIDILPVYEMSETEAPEPVNKTIRLIIAIKMTSSWV